MTIVKIVPTELLCTVIDVGISVYVVASFNVESNVAKAVRRGDKVRVLRVDVYSRELTNTMAGELWRIPEETSVIVLVTSGVI